MTKPDTIVYADLLGNIKARIRQAQMKAAMSVNAEMLATYWDIGRLIVDKQSSEGWGTRVIECLSTDLKNDISEVKGFSVRNLKLMTQFFREYPTLFSIGQPLVAQLEALSVHESIMQPLVTQMTWAHNICLIQKVKSLDTASGI